MTEQDAATEEASGTNQQHQQHLLTRRLTTKAENGEFYAEEALLSLELEQELDLLWKQGGDLPLVRLLEAFYVSQGTTRIHAKTLNCPDEQFRQLFAPFINATTNEKWRIPGDTVEEYRAHLQAVFQEHFSGMLICRGFFYAFWRFESETTTAKETQHKNDTLLDAYCVVRYIIQLLQGQIQEFGNLELGDILESEWSPHKHDQVDMTADDILWCCCILILRIGSELRRTLGPFATARSLSSSQNTTNHELGIAKLAMEIRPEAPVGYLWAYRMAMEQKVLIPSHLRQSWMETVYSFVAQGLEEAEQWGDPYYLYLFHVIGAYWMPTHTYKEEYSYAQLMERLEAAEFFKAEALLEGDTNRLWLGEHHENCLEYLLALHIFDKEAATMPSLTDASTYPVPPPPAVEGQEGGIDPTLHLAATSPGALQPNSCHFCRKALQDKEPSHNKDPRHAMCSRCKVAVYCSMECQGSHWKIHAAECSHSSGCGHCGEPLPSNKKLTNCSKCDMIQYCNRKCQLAHWKAGHKRDCKLMVR